MTYDQFFAQISGKQEIHLTDKDSKRSTGDIEGAAERGANRKGGADPNFLTLAVPRLSVCADAQKVDRAKLAQTEVIHFKRL